MTIEPSGEAEATTSPVQSPPEASLGNEADDDSTDSSPGESQSPDPLPADVPAADITAAPTQQDIEQASVETTTSTGQDGAQASMQTSTSTGHDKDQASIETVTSTAMSMSGDKDKGPDAPSLTQEKPEETTSLLPQDPGALQMFVGFQNPVWDRLAENTRANRSHTVSSDSQNQNETPQKPNDPEGQPETVPPAPNTELPSVPAEEIQPPVEVADTSTEDASGPILEPLTIAKAAEQEAEGLEALNPESEAGLPEETREYLDDDSRIPQSPPFLSSPESSAPPSPDPCQVSLGRNLLDINLYRPDVENDYMRSMTSLLGGDEGSISSLADILVWSDTAMGMGMAVGFLASGRSSPADMLHDEGPSLRTVSSLLGSARSVLSSGLVAGTGSALRSVTHLLESMERRTLEGIRSAVRYLTNHFTPRWARTGPDGD